MRLNSVWPSSLTAATVFVLAASVHAADHRKPLMDDAAHLHEEHDEIRESGPMPTGSLPARDVGESWDAPVVTIEREETVPGAVRRPMDDSKRIQHANDAESEQIEKNYIVNFKSKSSNEAANAPSSVSRTVTAGAVFFIIALLVILEM